MKSVCKILMAFCFLFALSQSSNSIFAQQRLSITGNYVLFSAEKVEDPSDDDISFDNERSASINLRLFDKNLWAFRVGLGSSKINYSVQDGFNTDYDYVRKNLTALLGLEKHFELGFLYPYVGVFIPISFNSKDEFKDITTDVSEQFKNGDVKAGFSLNAGANLKLFKILRLGAEFNVGFNKLKSEVDFGNLSNFNVNRLDYNTEITVGVAF